MLVRVSRLEIGDRPSPFAAAYGSFEAFTVWCEADMEAGRLDRPMGAQSSPPWRVGSGTVRGVPGGGRATGRAATIGERAGADLAGQLAGGKRGVRYRPRRAGNHTRPGGKDGPDGARGPPGLRGAAPLVLRRVPSPGAGAGPRCDPATRGQAGRVAAVHEVPQAILVR